MTLWFDSNLESTNCKFIPTLENQLRIALKFVESKERLKSLLEQNSSINCIIISDENAEQIVQFIYDEVNKDQMLTLDVIIFSITLQFPQNEKPWTSKYKIIKHVEKSPSELAKWMEKWIKAHSPEKRLIYWHDPNISGEENQHNLRYLGAGEMNFEIVNFTNYYKLVTQLEETSQDLVAIISSGSGGKELINAMSKTKLEKVHFVPVIIFCGNVEFHSKWAAKYFCVIKVTNQFEEVITLLKIIKFSQERSRFSCRREYFDYIYSEKDNIKEFQNKFFQALLFLKNKYHENHDLTDCIYELMNNRNYEFIKTLPQSTQSYYREENYQNIFTDLFEKNVSKIIRAFTMNGPISFEMNYQLSTLTASNYGLANLTYKLVQLILYHKELMFKGNQAYKAMQLSEEDIKLMSSSKGKIVFPGFTSATRKKEQIKLELKGNTIIIINLKNLKKVNFQPAVVSPFSSYPIEEEIIFPIGSQFKITKFQKNSDYHLNILEVTYEGTILNPDQLLGGIMSNPIPEEEKQKPPQSYPNQPIDPHPSRQIANFDLKHHKFSSPQSIPQPNPDFEVPASENIYSENLYEDPIHHHNNDSVHKIGSNHENDDPSILDEIENYKVKRIMKLKSTTKTKLEMERFKKVSLKEVNNIFLIDEMNATLDYSQIHVSSRSYFSKSGQMKALAAFISPSKVELMEDKFLKDRISSHMLDAEIMNVYMKSNKSFQDPEPNIFSKIPALKLNFGLATDFEFQECFNCKVFAGLNLVKMEEFEYFKAASFQDGVTIIFPQLLFGFDNLEQMNKFNGENFNVELTIYIGKKSELLEKTWFPKKSFTSKFPNVIFPMYSQFEVMIAENNQVHLKFLKNSFSDRMSEYRDDFNQLSKKP